MSNITYHLSNSTDIQDWYFTTSSANTSWIHLGDTQTKTKQDSLNGEDKKTYDLLISILSNYCGETGKPEGAVETLKRLLQERSAAISEVSLLKLQIPTKDAKIPHKIKTHNACECGGDKAKTTHSSWCPKENQNV